MNKDLYTNIITTSIEELEPHLPENPTPRQTTIEKIPKKITALIGMRRTGKTHLLYQEIQALLSKGIPKNQILFLNFEDDRYEEFTVNDFSNLIETYYHLFPENHDQKCYLFFDEIQYVPNWPRVLRRLMDTKNVSISITGSSAKMLSTEISTALRGRSLPTEVWPFSFQEFLTYHNIPHPRIIGKPTEDKLINHLKKYLLNGGFPEIQSVSEESRIRILQDYVQVVIFRDIIERYKITNTSLIKHLIRTMLRNTGRRYSIHKWHQDFKSLGIPVAKNTLHEYTSHIQDAFLTFSIPLFSESVKQQATNPKKIYSIDPGLTSAFTLNPEKEFGHLFENLVYLDLRRKNTSITYYLTKNHREVDFVAQYLNGKQEIIQVCWDMSNAETREREELALKEASKELGIPGRIITPQTYVRYGIENHENK